MPTCEHLLAEAAARLAGDTPLLDAELLLAHVTGLSRTSFRAWPEREIAPPQNRVFQALVERRANGEPVAYLLGEQGFWSLTLEVNESTLIPRPDTECLVEAALELPVPGTARVLDLGTGTGAIALALASERPGWHVIACDSSPGAVALAQRNAYRLALQVTVLQSHWFDQLPTGRFDLVVSNPPYISCGDQHLAQGDVRFEPQSALVAGDDGLQDIRHIVAKAPHWLLPGGWLMLEHGFDQGTAVAGLLEYFGFRGIATGQDYGRRDRYTLGQWPD